MTEQTRNDACRDDGCCEVTTSRSVKETVRSGYGAIARGERALSRSEDESESSGCCGGGGCCGVTTMTPDQVMSAVGYSQEEIGGLPAGANMGLSCGNPTALASLRDGEVVVDLGSGGGLDCFVAGPKVGSTGRVIGIDMTADMIDKARAALPTYRQASGLDNVEFRLGEIEHLPLPDSSVDVVISNCVINLSDDKAQVWREIARVLKPGGRVAVSDLALLKPLPRDVQEDMEALVGCIAGAVLIDETRAQAEAAGLVDVRLTPKADYLAAMETWEDPLYRRIASKLGKDARASDFVTSLDAEARKPA